MNRATVSPVSNGDIMQEDGKCSYQARKSHTPVERLTARPHCSTNPAIDTHIEMGKKREELLRHPPKHIHVHICKHI